MSNKVSPEYLKDITGKLSLVSLKELIESVKGVKGLLPPPVAEYKDKQDLDTNRDIDKYTCNVSQDKKSGDIQSCKLSKVDREYESQNTRNAQQQSYIQFSDKGKRIYFGNGRNQISIPSPKNKFTSIARYVIGQDSKLYESRGKHTRLAIEDDRRSKALLQQQAKDFKDAVNGVADKSIGQRAIIYNSDGTVSRGANAIRDESLAEELSSQIPSSKLNNGVAPKEIVNGKPLKTSKHPNKKGIGEVNDLVGGIAALGGITAIVGVLAVLMPLHFLTSAITFLTSITTFFTNVNNAVTTYLQVTEALLGVFGVKNATKSIKTFVSGLLDNVFGKENKGKIDEIKLAFAKGVNSIAVGTKLLEKIEQGRNSTDGKVDGIAYQLGTVNNYMKEGGLIPADSPYMAQSKAIDDLVEKRSTEDNNLKSNIETLTSEIKDPVESRKELAEEQKIIDDKNKKISKDINDLKLLGDSTKVNADKILSEKV